MQLLQCLGARQPRSSLDVSRVGAGATATAGINRMRVSLAPMAMGSSPFASQSRVALTPVLESAAATPPLESPLAADALRTPPH